MSVSPKKVIVRTLENALHAGYLPLSGFLSRNDHQPEVGLLDLSGRISPIPLADVRWIAFVRDFNLGNDTNPEQLARRTFLARPRSEGLWVRLTFAKGETLEGLAPASVSLLDALLEDRGLFLTPPDMRGNTQRLYLPRSAIEALEILAVITTPSKTAPAKITKKAGQDGQELLFPRP